MIGRPGSLFGIVAAAAFAVALSLPTGDFNRAFGVGPTDPNDPNSTPSHNYTVYFGDDFSEWTNFNEAESAPFLFPVFNPIPSNTNRLEWNLTALIGSTIPGPPNAARWNRFEYVAPPGATICQVRFNYRIENEGDNAPGPNSTVLLQLVDTSNVANDPNLAAPDIILFTGVDTGIPGGATGANVMTDLTVGEVVAVDPPATAISFRYFQYAEHDRILGSPGPPLFLHDDMDAIVDDVVLTIQDNCPQGDLNHDCSQNLIDYSLLAANWMVCDEVDPLDCP